MLFQCIHPIEHPYTAILTENYSEASVTICPTSQLELLRAFEETFWSIEPELFRNLQQ